MTARRRYVVACLAGHGIGPEVTAAASRALSRLGREHGFDVEELHPPFDTEALTRSGHLLPAATRRATLDSDAVLAAGDAAPALAGVREALDLRATVTRVLDDTGEVTAFAPRDEDAADWALGRAFETAKARSGRLTSVGVSSSWTARVDRHADDHPGVDVEHVALPDALRRLGSGSTGVLVAEAVLAATVAEAPRLAGRRRLVATGHLSPAGPGLFAPAEGTTSDLAGQGVADPSPMLLATALLLSEGLGRTSRRRRARGEPLGRASRVANAARRGRVRRRGDDARVRRHGARPAAERAPRHRVRPRSRAMKITGGDAILRSLEAEGVDVMFGIPGGAIMPTYDAMARGTTVRHVLARHEQGAGHMAQGYARASGRVGVAIATSGPGATNLVTPIADAWMDSTPLVCITGQVRSMLIGTDAFQECDITGITMPIVKHSWLVQEAREIPEVMAAAFHVARTGRCGPVLVDVPRDLQEALIDFSYPEQVDLPGWRPPAKVHPLQIREAARAIAHARKPVLYVGGGTLNGNACEELHALAEAGSLPVITTLMGKSAFPENHDLHFGWPGMHGAKWSNLAMNTCDVLVAIGSRFDDRVTGKLSAFAPGATVVHLDVDPAEISKLREADIPVVGPLAKAVAALGEEVARHRADGVPPPTAWLDQIRAWREEFPLRYGNGGEWLKPQRVVETLQALTADEDVIVTTGVGQHQMWAMQYVQSIRPRSFITSGGLGTMGYGIPAAIGAKAARPEATVVCVDGDGCFQMTAQELTTAVLDDLPIVVVLVNNGYLGMVTQWQDMFFDGRRSHVHLTTQVPDYAKLAEAYGGVGMVVESEAELEPALSEALTLGRTVVVDCRVDPAEHCFPMIPAGAAALDMIEYSEAVEEAKAS